nr:hypothetical protein [Tanacetum cinerariifolium]
MRRSGIGVARTILLGRHGHRKCQLETRCGAPRHGCQLDAGRVVAEHVIIFIARVAGHAFRVAIDGGHGGASAFGESYLSHFQRSAAGAVHVHMDVGGAARIPAGKDAGKRNLAVGVGGLAPAQEVHRRVVG